MEGVQPGSVHRGPGPGVGGVTLRAPLIHYSFRDLEQLRRRGIHAGPDDDLDAYLRSAGVPGIAGVDTRRLTRHLRDAGAIIFAKVNLSEFAGGAQYSSLGGQSLSGQSLSGQSLSTGGSEPQAAPRGTPSCARIATGSSRSRC